MSDKEKPNKTTQVVREAMRIVSKDVRDPKVVRDGVVSKPKINNMEEITTIIDLLNLDVNVKYDYEMGGYSGVKSTDGALEYIHPSIYISSIKCNGIELIKVIDEDQLRGIEQSLLEKISNPS